VSIRASRPNLQKMVEEEADDPDAVSKLLELGSMIDADLEKYEKLRKGDFQGASQVTVKPMYCRPNSPNIVPLPRSRLTADQ
jgi:ADP-ribosylation factor-binding protein GGA